MPEDPSPSGDFEGMLIWGSLTIPQAQWLVPDRDYFALDKDLAKKDFFLRVLCTLNYGWHVLESGGNFSLKRK